MNDLTINFMAKFATGTTKLSFYLDTAMSQSDFDLSTGICFEVNLIDYIFYRNIEHKKFFPLISQLPKSVYAFQSYHVFSNHHKCHNTVS